jgi:hypothetical protein
MNSIFIHLIQHWPKPPTIDLVGVQLWLAIGRVHPGWCTGFVVVAVNIGIRVVAAVVGSFVLVFS